MLIKIRKGWELPESMATPEGIALNRRLFLAGASAAGLSIASADTAWAAADKDPTADLYPAKRNEKFKTAGRAITPEDINSTYNNFYEFGSHKEISSAAQALKVRPWRLKVPARMPTSVIGLSKGAAGRRVELSQRAVSTHFSGSMQ